MTAPVENPAPPAETMVGGDVEIVTFGCRLNAWESEVVRDHARAAGMADTVVVNTCAVTAEAVRQARQTIRRIKRERPGVELVVTGCAAQIDPDMFARMPEVGRVVGNAEKLRAETWRPLTISGGGASDGTVSEQAGAPGGLSGSASGAAARVSVGDIMSVREIAGHLVDGLDGKARAYVQVQTGCDHRCTFCIIPYGRGNARSAPAGEVVSQVRRLVETGHSEVVLTGVDLTSWGGDLPGAPKLGRLVTAILREIPELARLRLSSIDAIEIDDTLFRAIAEEERVCPYLHLSLQSGDDMILKRMKRRHSRAEAVDLTRRLRAARPEIAFGADLIAGFPTETDAMFDNSVALVEDCDLSFLHVFPYSPRPGTPAARMPQVEAAVIKARAARLREAGAAALLRHLDRRVGAEMTAIVERPGAARADDFTPIRVDSPARPGAMIRVRATGHDGERLIGVAAGAA